MPTSVSKFEVSKPQRRGGGDLRQSSVAQKNSAIREKKFITNTKILLSYYCNHAL